MPRDAIVVGAGIVGAACAEALARDGRRVLVLDARFAAGGTTASGMGHLVVMDDSPAQLALTALSVSLWRELARDLPSATEYDQCGTIWVAAEEPELESVRAKQRVYAAHGIASDVLGARDIAELEPNLRAGLAGGLLVPGDGVIYQPRATTWLLDRARAASHVELREGCLVEQISANTVHCRGGEDLTADIIVNAAGAEAARLTADLPIVPRKGHLAITDRAPGFVRHQLVELGYLASAHTVTGDSVAFNVQPRATEQVLVGSSRELAGWDATTNCALLHRMLARAIEFMPALARLAVIRTWTGFRPATPDKLPLVGAWEPVPGLWIAAGHEGLGITTALGTAKVLADLIAGRRPAIDPQPFSPMRVLGGRATAARHSSGETSERQWHDNF